MEVLPPTEVQEPIIEPYQGIEGLETGRENYFFPEHMFSVNAGSLEEANGKLRQYLANPPKEL